MVVSEHAMWLTPYISCICCCALSEKSWPHPNIPGGLLQRHAGQILIFPDGPLSDSMLPEPYS
jgi:hypothetical protein